MWGRGWACGEEEAGPQGALGRVDVGMAVLDAEKKEVCGGLGRVPLWKGGRAAGGLLPFRRPDSLSLGGTKPGTALPQRQWRAGPWLQFVSPPAVGKGPLEGAGQAVTTSEMTRSSWPGGWAGQGGAIGKEAPRAAAAPPPSVRS